MLAKTMLDLQMPSDATYGKLSVLAGTRSDCVGKILCITTDTCARTAFDTAVNRTIAINGISPFLDKIL
jgi:hypothetical protein